MSAATTLSANIDETVRRAFWLTASTTTGRSLRFSIHARSKRTLVSAPETALLTCDDEGLLEGILRQGGGVETGRQEGFDLDERLRLTAPSIWLAGDIT